MNEKIKKIEDKYKRELPKFNVGDTVRVDYKVIEGKRERIQAFEGIVIKIQGTGVRKTFTVRKISSGIGVERTFPMNSPKIDGIKVIRQGKVRRARLHYLRDRVGKAARVKEKVRTNPNNKK